MGDVSQAETYATEAPAEGEEVVLTSEEHASAVETLLEFGTLFIEEFILVPNLRAPKGEVTVPQLFKLIRKVVNAALYTQRLQALHLLSLQGVIGGVHGDVLNEVLETLASETIKPLETALRGASYEEMLDAYDKT
jgi:hypothetical protein